MLQFAILAAKVSELVGLSVTLINLLVLQLFHTKLLHFAYNLIK